MEKKLKSVPKGEAVLKDAIEKAVEAGKEKINNVTINFVDGEVVDYVDTKGYSITGAFLIIQQHNDTQIVYPVGNIKSFVLFSTNKE